MTTSHALVTIQSQISSNIWVAPNGDAGGPRQLTSRSNADEGFFGVTWTPDGRIVYSSTAAIKHSNLWIMNGDGSNPKQLTDSPADDMLPAASPDGRYIVFTSNRSGKLNLWRMDTDGSNLKQLTNGVALEPDFSPDGRWVACIFVQSGKMSLWKVPVDGASPVQLTETFANAPVVSSNGKLIAYFYYDERAEKKTKVVIIPSDGGAPVKVLDYTPAPPPNVGLQWTPDDSSIVYQDGRQGGANLWRLPLNGSPARQLTDFTDNQRVLRDALDRLEVSQVASRLEDALRMTQARVGAVVRYPVHIHHFWVNRHLDSPIRRGRPASFVISFSDVRRCVCHHSRPAGRSRHRDAGWNEHRGQYGVQRYGRIDDRLGGRDALFVHGRHRSPANGTPCA